MILFGNQRLNRKLFDLHHYQNLPENHKMDRTRHIQLLSLEFRPERYSTGPIFRTITSRTFASRLIVFEFWQFNSL